MAVFALSFVHHPPASVARGIPQSELAQYILPDGTLPVLCLTVTEDGTTKTKHVAVSECAACRIGDAAVVPDPLDLEGRRLDLAPAPLWPAIGRPAVAERLADDAPPRAPPHPHSA
ncbi:hypothetical protein GWI72_17460 [Microvirga tunisiensis]|uniref:Uncharacterized protein n=2 Tax=Pannonibacter tanglangensis TaxID=2750084 RepID=A0A7X5F5H3_9HYPH|nr:MULTISPECIES: hypothetical protein [unclassified Pannonibacter]NBN65705.1 hypothetical protein [Pannonibacter sp. XCT-34]NBN80068.1 hypothetical protein [Pannonibacter sp. XCT-53]